MLNIYRIWAAKRPIIVQCGHGLLSGPSVYNGAKGRKAAVHCVMRPKAAKWLIIVQRSLFPVFSTLPKLGAFTLHADKLVYFVSFSSLNIFINDERERVTTKKFEFQEEEISVTAFDIFVFRKTLHHHIPLCFNTGITSIVLHRLG